MREESGKVIRKRRKLNKKETYDLVLRLGAVAAVTLFVISLIPVIYVGFFNYATGDDYWYGVHTYRGFVEDGLIGALKGSLLTVKEFFYGWQGTWFTMFLFTLSPNHFWENGYVLTVFISLGLLIASVSLLSHYYLRKKLQFRSSTTVIITCLVLYLMIQYIPRTTSGIYWFNGIMHYSVPFFLAVLAIIYSHKFIEEKGKKNYGILFFSFLLLGGGSYLAPLAATLAVLLLLLVAIRGEEFDRKKRVLKLSYDFKNLWILLAILAEGVGLVISFLAPGNSVRGGEEFGADPLWALKSVIYAIDRGIYLGEDYFKENFVTTAVFLFIGVLLWMELWEREGSRKEFRFPLIFVIYLNGIYWATYTPEIYARSDVSGGVPNTYFHIFLLVTLANMVYVHGWIQKMIKKSSFFVPAEEREEKIKREQESKENRETKEGSSATGLMGKLKYPVLTAAFLLMIYTVSSSELITTYDYCMDYITSGKMEKYLEVRRTQHEILTTTEEEEVVVPEMEGTYPLTNMCLTENVNAERNMDRAKYYNKKSVGMIMVD